MRPTTPALAALLPLVLGLTASDLAACNGRKTGAKPVARVRATGATSWHVYVPGWVTLATPKGAWCATGLSVPANGPITAVTAVAMFHETNSASIPQLSFGTSNAVAAGFQAKRAGNWTGFLAQAAAAIPAKLPNMYCFSVTTKSGTTFAQIAVALRGSFVGSDKADAQGKLSGQNEVIFQFTIIEQDTSSHNWRRFHDAGSANVSARVTADKADTIFFMQPRSFRFGQGDATGWRGRFQDQDPSTAEEVEFGYVSYATSASGLPNVTPAGSLTSIRFTLFGTGGPRAVEFTLTSAGKIPLPSFGGLRVTLPAPRAWPRDGITVHTQEGRLSKLDKALRSQWTYSLQGTAAVPFLDAGTTHDLAGLYDSPTQQVYALSKAYGPQRRLFGPESLYPDVKSGDLVGFEIHSDRFQSGTFALVMVAPSYQPRPLPTPFGALLVTPFVTTALVIMDSRGVGRSIAFPLGPGIMVAVQGVLLDFSPLRMLFTDAARFKTQS